MIRCWRWAWKCMQTNRAKDRGLMTACSIDFPIVKTGPHCDEAAILISSR